jgi:pyridoxal phosphate enzyme (YggS family)
MPVNKENYFKLLDELNSKNVTLVAVSKTKPVEDIHELYALGQRDFGENYVQELVAKYEQLPKDIRWHFIGHLQSNKVKYIAPFVHLIHGIDSARLLKEVSKQAQKLSRQLHVLLQVHIAQEETKFGLDENELEQVLDQNNSLTNVSIDGLMGMASFTENQDQVRKEFQSLKHLFNSYAQRQTSNLKLQTLSMGMSADYQIAIEEGSTMVRIGSLLFGERI